MTSVKQKVAAIHKKCSEINAGARKIESKIGEQERVNRAAVAHIETGIKKVQAGIRSQAAENAAYIKDFHFGESKK